MTKEDKIKIAIKKGYTCDPKTGKIFGMRGSEIGKTDNRGRKSFTFIHEKNRLYLFSHQFIYYWVYGEVVDLIDHIDRNPSNNKIENLRSITHTENMWNKDPQGYTLLNNGKYRAQIGYKNKQHIIGYYDSEADAHSAYLNAKKIHHLVSPVRE